MNLKTWYWLARFAVVFLFVGTVVAFGTHEPAWRDVPMMLFVALAIYGAVLGIKLGLGRLFFGCPICAARSKVVSASKRWLTLECPQCGEVRVTTSPWKSLRYECMPRRRASPQGGRMVTLETDNGQRRENPSSEELCAAVARAGSQALGGFLILATDELAYLQASACERAAFRVEYQEGDVTRHYEATRSFSSEELVRALESYRQGTEDWRRMADWRHLPL
jgi:predicted RNA-binding Zn-ribbon protein involved in translation (DUF1610 family)